MSRSFTALDVRAALSVSSEWDLPEAESVRSAYFCANRGTSRPIADVGQELAWSLFDWDGHGYDIAYYIGDDDALEGSVLCGGCAAAFLATDDDNKVWPAFQINGEVGDTESAYCDDCGGLIYAGEEFDYDKSNAA